MTTDGNELILTEAARGGLCPGVDAKELLKEEEEKEHIGNQCQVQARQQDGDKF